MKKIISICILLVLCVPFAYNQYISQQEAELIAKNYIETTLFRKNRTLSASTKEVSEIKQTQYNNRPSYYAINFSGGGFVVVSAVEDFEPILAYSPQGKFEIDDMSSACAWWMEGYSIAMDSIATNNVSSTECRQKRQSLKESTLKKEIETTSKNRVAASYNINETQGSIAGPFLKNSWGQGRCDLNGYPLYNRHVEDGGLGSDLSCESCSREQKCPVGCVALSIGQVMRHHQHANRYFDWNNMPDSLRKNSPIAEIDAVATLLADIGKRLQMNYCHGGATCSSGALFSAGTSKILESYGYMNSKFTDRYNDTINFFNTLYNEMYLHRPVLISGNPGAGFSGSGHAWVADGYRYDNVNQVDQFHFNWGEYNKNDGYYDLDNQYYSRSLSILYNINPEEELDCESRVHIAQDFGNMGDSVLYLAYNPPTYGYIKNGNRARNVKFRTIPANVTSQYKAYENITLTLGFTAKAGCNFTASLVPCPLKIMDIQEGQMQAMPFMNEEPEISMNEFLKKNGIQVYPFPAQQELNVLLEKLHEDIKALQVYDTKGTLMEYTENISELVKLNVSPYPDGVYILRALYKDNTQQSLKFMVKK